MRTNYPRVVIDTAIIFHQALNVDYGKKRYRGKRRQRPYATQSLLFYRCLSFLEHRIDPIFVIEGAQISSNTRKRSPPPMSVWMRKMERLLSLMGVASIRAPGEGEATGAHLVKCGDADAIATTDIDDAFFFGSLCCIKSNLHADLLDHPRITLAMWLDSLGLRTLAEYRDYFILCGNDYNKKLLPRGMGRRTAQKLIQEHQTVENIPNLEIDLETVKLVRLIGRNPAVPKTYSITFKEPKYEKIHRFLTKRCGFSDKRADVGVDRLKTQMLRNRLHRKEGS